MKKINVEDLQIVKIFDIDYLESLIIYIIKDENEFDRKYLLRKWIFDEFNYFCFVCGQIIGPIEEYKRVTKNPWPHHQECHPKIYTRKEIIEELSNLGFTLEEIASIDWGIWLGFY